MDKIAPIMVTEDVRAASEGEHAEDGGGSEDLGGVAWLEG